VEQFLLASTVAVLADLEVAELEVVELATDEKREKKEGKNKAILLYIYSLVTHRGGSGERSQGFILKFH
jgi:hypothetical protein